MNGTLQLATYQDGLEAMNQLEAPMPAPRATAESTRTPSSAVLAGPSPPLVLAKEGKHDRPELDQEDDEQAQDNQQCGDYSGSQQGLNGCSLDDASEPMVNYDGFESLGRSFGTACLTRFVLADDDGDDDVVNVRSPIICKPASSNDACSRSATLSPTCVSALGHDEVQGSAEPSWTIQEFQEYLGMLEMLEEVCSSSEMCLSADSLGQMERLLTSLLPQGV
ncbi:hypothetical protein PRNP1_005398 [Phytophthora ramorum]